MTQDDLKLLNKDKKKVKKLAASYHAFLASASLIRQIPRLIGPGLSKAGKFPAVINTNDSVADKIEEQKATVKFQLKSKKSLCLAVAVANVDMTPAQIQENIVLAINFFVSLLPKNWQQVKRIHMHATMGPSFKIFGM
jgi:large subunit ribosomal protein L10Ae